MLDVARAHGLRPHLDGARLMNAVVASGVDAADWAGGFDSAWLDFTKGLGAPVGACLAGSAAFIEEAWRWKQMLGGAMRQAGIVAAAGLYALDHHVERLAEDHATRPRLAEGLAALPGVELDAATVRDQHRDLRGARRGRASCAALARRRRLDEPLRAHARARGHPPRRRRRRGSTGRWRSPREAPRVACGHGDRLQHLPAVRGHLRACRSRSTTAR